MKGNDLSDEPVPRVAVVFEGALGLLDAQDEKLFGKLMDKKKYAEAVQLFQLNELMVKVIWDRAWRDNLRIDIITYLGPKEWAQAIADALAEEELPIHQVWATRPDILARKISWTQDLIRVYDPFPEHKLFFGAKGRYLTDCNQVGRV